ncbi:MULTISPECIES: hypothetical protein [Streptomyces]|uniref:TIGR04222 domain-containing membrane protein n=1 Tax=Streptomyces doudnae TaxID=3075536 RepID=A0ABD5ELX8_9ACTN|nr:MULTISPECIES: hypothetical protein [unclassified Streptomyces]MDT0435683.1 hypothetical protein [Streptomyces sp. DSM 41981]MYQ62636.1 hypothetical protein [Streptomyces sp. SID4950]SCD41177.1 hypothetical protein GA0115242_1048143 [Streptomyces sp. SolWspMP-5a-2]
MTWLYVALASAALAVGVGRALHALARDAAGGMRGEESARGYEPGAAADRDAEVEAAVHRHPASRPRTRVFLPGPRRER